MGIEIKLTQTFVTDDGMEHLQYEHANFRQFAIELQSAFTDMGVQIEWPDVIHIRDNISYITDACQAFEIRERENEEN